MLFPCCSPAEAGVVSHWCVSFIEFPRQSLIAAAVAQRGQPTQHDRRTSTHAFSVERLMLMCLQVEINVQKTIRHEVDGQSIEVPLDDDSQQRSRDIKTSPEI